MNSAMRDHLANSRLDRLQATAKAVMSGEKKMTCTECGLDCGYASIAGLVIQYGGNVFCSEFCLEVFLDRTQS